MVKHNDNGKPKGKKPKGQGVRFVRYFRHYRTGKRMDAHEYGLVAWPIRGEKKKS